MFRIFTDTSSNLDSELLKRKNVSVVPFSYYVNGEEHTCLDTHAFNGSGYYDAIRNGVRVTTSQVPPQRYIDAMTPVLAGGEDILFVGMSSGISGAYSAAEMAAGRLLEQFPERKIRLVDTLSASLAEGIVVLHAIELREEGKSLDETADELMELRHSVCQIFTVEDLRYLRMGGRLSNIAALVGTVLQIKPLLKGDPEGKIVCFAKPRGRKRSIAELGIYPAVDPLESTSRALEPAIVGEEHYRVATGIQELLQNYKDLQDIIAILGMDELTEEQKLTVSRARKAQQFFGQCFHVATQFTGLPGKYVKMEDTVRSFAAILDGECDEIPEQCFRLKGGIDDVYAEYEAMKKDEA